MHVEREANLVRQWWAASTLEEFCQVSGLDKRTASNWAAAKRKADVMLKAMPRKSNPTDEHLSRNDMDYLRRLSEAIANGEDLTLEVFQQQEPEVVDEEEAERAERVERDKAEGDKRRGKTAAASQWSSVNGDD